MRIKLFLLFMAMPLCIHAGYSSSATVTFAPAQSATATNITLAFSGSDAKLRTAANGGQIQDTVMRAGVSVPADFVLTTDSSCKTVTGYNWGIEFYDATNGIVKGWVLIPSLTASASVIPTVCIDNAAVTTYQGGAQGAEFDSWSQAVYHLPNGSTLSGADFSANNAVGTVVGATATAGQIDGGASFNGSSQYINAGITSPLNITGPITLECWFKFSSYGSGVLYTLLGRGYDGTNTAYQLSFSSGSGSTNRLEVVSYASGMGGSTAAYYNGHVFSSSDDGLWYYGAATWNGTAWAVYLNGSASTTAEGQWVGPPASANAPFVMASQYQAGSYAAYFPGILDEVRVSNTGRSAGWIATEYANQLSPPSIGPFAPLAVRDRLIIF